MSEKVMQKIANGREYRDMVLTVSDSNEEEMIVEGYATTYDEPYELYRFDENTTVMEQVSRDAFVGTDMSDVIFQYNHEGRVFARISNGTLELTSDEHGLKTVANLGGTNEGRNLYQEIKGGYTNKMSFGFTVEEDDIEVMEESENNVVYLRTIRKIGKLYDVSAVSIPANNYTEISARNRVDGEIEAIQTERLNLAKQKLENEKARQKLALRIKMMKGVK